MSERERAVRILVVDDDAPFRERLLKALRVRGYEAQGAPSAHEALALTGPFSPTHAIVDLRLAQDSGLDVLSALRDKSQVTVVVLTGYGSVATALEAVRRGARNYLAKPTGVDAILAALFGEPLASDAASAPVENSPTPSLDEVAWEHIQRVLRECDGNVSHAAKRLGLHRQSLQRKLRCPPTP